MTRRDLAPPLVKAETFPPRQNVHKYWGKKPANVVRAYVERFAEPGATVLDVFAGSGVTLTESLLAGRRAVALDVNPIAGLITRVVAEAAPPAALVRRAEGVLAGLRELRRALFAEPCRACGAEAEVVSTGYDGDRPVRVTVECPHCGMLSYAPAGRAAGGAALPSPGDHPDDEVFPGWEMQKLVRRGVRRWSELFTPRNLVAVAHLRRAIAAVEDPPLRRALTVSFTAHLAQATRMIADFKGDAGGPSWKLNCYWLPPRWQELNPFRYFLNRVRKTASGIADMRQRSGRAFTEGADYEIHARSAERVGEVVPRGGAGYIFTDPPYGGEAIQYGELSMLWNLWAGLPRAITEEVVSNPYHRKSPEHYARRLEACLAAAFEALAPAGWMSVTFANKDSAVWGALLAAGRRAGFALASVVPMSQSASNITNKVTRGAPKTDLILNFFKPRSVSPARDPAPAVAAFDFERAARAGARRLAASRPAFRTSELYDRLLIEWMTSIYLRDAGAGERFTLGQVEALLAALPDLVRERAAARDGDSRWRRR